MSVDTLTIIEELSYLIAGIVLVFLISRAVTIGRKFASPIYRSRAFLFAGVMLVALYDVLAALITVLFGLYPSTSILSGLAITAFIVWVLVMFVYADRTILVTLEMDFLHRNTLHWRPVRTLAYAVMFASVADTYIFIALTKPPTYWHCPTSQLLCLPAYLPGVPSWLSALFPEIGLLVSIFAFIVTLAYSISALIIGARRTSDMTMKRHVKWLGLAFLIFLLTFVGFLAGNVFVSVVILALVYVFYRALMSLTLIGRVERQTK